jgi:hypothetical protein
MDRYSRLERLQTCSKTNPERSNRQTAKIVGVDDKTVGSVRTDMERRAEIPHVAKRVDTKGRQQPARKKPVPPPDPERQEPSRIEPHETCLMRVRAMILDEWLPQIPSSKLTQFVAELRDEIDDIERVIKKRMAQQHADKAQAEALH